MKQFLKNRNVLVAGAIAFACAVLPGMIGRARRDRFIVPGESGLEKVESREQKAETGAETNNAESRKRKAQNGAVGFETRYMYGGRGDAVREWERRNGIGRRIEFSHNLNNIFPPSECLWHPEFFPLIEGERLQPPRGSYFWQPDLGREDVAAWAAEAARRHFEAHPDAISFAVGVNDGLIFGESEETLALIRAGDGGNVRDGATGSEAVSRSSSGTVRTESLSHGVTESGDGRGIRFFRQRPDFTDLVYTFTNRVAKDVATTHPDKYVGALAYYWCENAPSFPLEANVIPFLTADRSQGYDERFREEERALQREWAHAHGVDSPRNARTTGNTADEDVRAPTPSRRLGLYDYLYGSGFLIPRVHTRLIADNLRQARRFGFTDYFAELNPNWGLDGPMPWLVAQLLQDPEQAREVLLEEYYSSYFCDAAVPMRRFFERCEYQWMTQPGPAYWLKHYRNESQARLFPSAVCRELRALLDEAVRQARDEITKKRVAFVSDTFGVTERFVAFCEAREELNRAVLRADASGFDLQEAARGRTEIGRKEAQKAQENQTGATDARIELGSIPVQTNHTGLDLQQGTRGGTEFGRKEAGERWTVNGGREMGGEAVKQSRGEAAGAAIGSGSQDHDITVLQQRVDGDVRAPKELSSRFRETRAEFVAYTMTLMEREPQALAPFVWADYLRHQPPRATDAARYPNTIEDGLAADPKDNPNRVAQNTPRPGAAGHPSQEGKGEVAQRDRAADLVAKVMATPAAAAGASQPQAFNLPGSRRVKPFTEFRDLTTGPIVPAWTVGGLRYGVALPEGWQSYVEPSEFQSAEVKEGVLRLTGNKETFVYQWLPAAAGAIYRARVQVRGQVQPGTTVILALSWLDSQQRRIGSKIHRLPEGEWPKWVRLEAEDTAPAGTAWVGVGLRVQNQMGPDWVHAKEFRLEKQ